MALSLQILSFSLLSPLWNHLFISKLSFFPLGLEFLFDYSLKFLTLKCNSLFTFMLSTNFLKYLLLLFQSPCLLILLSRPPVGLLLSTISLLIPLVILLYIYESFESQVYKMKVAEIKAGNFCSWKRIFLFFQQKPK